MVDYYIFALKKLGLVTRKVSLLSDSGDSHEAVEIRFPKSDHWMLSDPTFNSYFEIEGAKGYQSTERLQAAVKQGKQIHPIFYGRKIKDNRTVGQYYIEYERLLENISYPDDI